MRSAYWRKTRAQKEWKVNAQTSLPWSPSMVSRRSFSSPAALLVKVIARICHGRAGDTAIISTRSSVSGAPLSSAACIAWTSISLASSGT